MKANFKSERQTARQRFIKNRLKDYRPYNHDDAKPLFSSKSRAVVNGDLTSYAGPWGDKQITHLLKRTGFGMSKSELIHFRTLTMEQAIDQLLTEMEAPAPPVNDYNDATYDVLDPEVPFGETWINAAYDANIEGERVISLKSWFIDQFLAQDQPVARRSIHPYLNLFWHNLLVTETWGVFNGPWSYTYLETIRRHALGNYKDLVKEISLGHAMLMYLNGAFNNKYEPDENFARELQELFCIGKGPDANYTEGDVQAAARVMTGFTFDWYDDFRIYFNPDIHDESDKQFSSFYNNRVISGRTGPDGQQEFDELIDMIFDNSETAKFLSRRLYQFFVYGEIDDWAEVNVIEPMAELIRNNNYNIKPALECLLKSDHFYQEENYGVLIKSPAELVVGTWRSFNAQYPADDIQSKHYARQSLLWTMSNQGMEIGDPPSVSGWPAYYQAPVYDKSWITTHTIQGRAQTTDAFVYWGLWNAVESVNIDLLAFNASLDTPDDPNEVIRESALILLGLELSDAQAIDLKKILLTGHDSDGYWTAAWIDYIQDPINDMKREIVEMRLKWTFQQILQLPEYHLK